MENKAAIKCIVREDANEISTQVRVQQICNGFVVRTGLDPTFYPDIGKAADAIKAGIEGAPWPKLKAGPPE